jgi:hypothetical protein
MNTGKKKKSNKRDIYESNNNKTNTTILKQFIGINYGVNNGNINNDPEFETWSFTEKRTWAESESRS